MCVWTFGRACCKGAEQVIAGSSPAGNSRSTGRNEAGRGKFDSTSKFVGVLTFGGDLGICVFLLDRSSGRASKNKKHVFWRRLQTGVPNRCLVFVGPPRRGNFGFIIWLLVRVCQTPVFYLFFGKTSQHLFKTCFLERPNLFLRAQSPARQSGITLTSILKQKCVM